MSTTPNTLEYAISSLFTLTPEHAAQMEQYFIRQWELNYLYGMMNGKTVEYGGVIYNARVMNDLHSKQVRLSFRKPKESTGLPAYVLIKRAT